MHIFELYEQNISQFWCTKHCIYKAMYHTQTAKKPKALIYGPVWQSSNSHIQMFVKLPNWQSI